MKKYLFLAVFSLISINLVSGDYSAHTGQTFTKEGLVEAIANKIESYKTSSTTINKLKEANKALDEKYETLTKANKALEETLKTKTFGKSHSAFQTIQKNKRQITLNENQKALNDINLTDLQKKQANFKETVTNVIDKGYFGEPNFENTLGNKMLNDVPAFFNNLETLGIKSSSLDDIFYVLGNPPQPGLEPKDFVNQVTNAFLDRQSIETSIKSLINNAAPDSGISSRDLVKQASELSEKLNLTKYLSQNLLKLDSISTKVNEARKYLTQETSITPDDFKQISDFKDAISKLSAYKSPITIREKIASAFTKFGDKIRKAFNLETKLNQLQEAVRKAKAKLGEGRNKAVEEANRGNLEGRLDSEQAQDITTIGQRVADQAEQARQQDAPPSSSTSRAQTGSSDRGGIDIHRISDNNPTEEHLDEPGRVEAAKPFEARP